MSTDATDDVAEATRKRISDALLAPFPTNLIKQKQGMDYISAEDIRYRLIDATANQFSWTHNFWEIREADGVMRANQKSGIVPRVMVYGGTLSIPGLGARVGIGVQEMQDGQGADAAYKGAESDAFKRAAMSFGVGLVQLYMDSPPVQNAPQRTQTRSAPPKQDAPVTMTDDQFAKQVHESIRMKDGEMFRRLAETAGGDIPRWRVLIKATETVPALDWIVRQIERRNISNDDLTMEADAQRNLLNEGAITSPKA